MIEYIYPEEKQVALFFADQLNDDAVKIILECGTVDSSEDAIRLSKFFWEIVTLSAENKIQLPVEGGAEFWTEKLYNSFGSYIHKVGFGALWDEEVDKA